MFLVKIFLIRLRPAKSQIIQIVSMKALINRLEEKSQNQQELLKMIDNKLFEKLYEFCYVRTSDSSKVQEVMHIIYVQVFLITTKDIY